MRKSNFTTIISILVLGAAVFFGAYMLLGEKQTSTSNTIPTPPVLGSYPNITPIPPAPKSDSLAEIDYTSLEKNRLFTEEEGKYVNLSEIGKRLLRAILVRSECVDNPSATYCTDENTLANSSIVALKNNILLLKVPTVKGEYYHAYDLVRHEYADKGITTSNFLRNSMVIVFMEDKYMLYYKPGMNTPQEVPGSKLEGNHTYAELYGFVNKIDATFINDKTIKASIFDDSQLSPAEPYKERLHKQIREKTFVIE